MVSATSEASANGPSRQNAQETAVGISVFVQPDAPGFRCILKQRYTDFLVNEILPNGDVLHLLQDTSEQDRKRKRDGNGSVAHKKPRTESDIHTTKDSNGAAKDNEDAAPDGVSDLLSSKEDGKASDVSLQSVKDDAIAGITEADKAILNDLFGKHITSSILSLYGAVVAYPHRKPRDHATVNSEPFVEKSKRTEAHMCIRRIFSSKLETLTLQDAEAAQAGSVISIKAAPSRSISTSNGSRNNEGRRGKHNWAELGGEYIHCTLYKENKDTMEVLYFLASQLKMHLKHFSFAGTKDRRGVTVQRIAIHRVKRDRLEHLNRLGRGWRLGGPWIYEPEPLALGMLSGNQFSITLRDAHFDGEQAHWSIDQRLEHAKAVSEASAKQISSSGYLNYYGLQRFGSYATGTHIVGMRMLKGDLKGAVDAIMSYDPAVLEEGPEDGRKIPQDDIARASGIRAFVDSGSSTGALDQLPRRFSAERSLVTHLGKQDRKNHSSPNANDFQGGLMSIQRNLRLMYVHAYQSFIWNTVAGKRWELYREKVVEGDLVVIGEKVHVNDVNDSSKAATLEVDQDGEPIFHPSASALPSKDEDHPNGGPGAIADDPYVRARPLTRTEAASGTYNVFDLVLPLPGYDVLYPTNEIGQFYEELMASEAGGGLDPHNMRRAWKDVSLSGGYRKMMSRPLGDDVQVDVKMYGAPDEQLVQTDLEKLQNAAEATPPATDELNGTETKDKLAVILRMRLGSSQYATMALRELTKGGATGYRPDFSAPNR